MESLLIGMFAEREREWEREMGYDALNLSPSSRENSFMSKFMTKSGFDEQQ